MEQIQKDLAAEYRKWLLERLVCRDPKVTEAFRLKDLDPIAFRLKGQDPDLIPEKYSCKENHLIVEEIYNKIMSHGDYDKGLLEIAKTEKLLCVPKDDGITHINVYSKGKTKLGRALSNFAPLGFEHPIDGKCASVEGYWYYLKTGRQFPYLKNLWGFNAKTEGKKYPYVELSDFIIQIKQAITCKILQNPNLSSALKKSDLPLTHYYSYGSDDNPKVILMDADRWMLDHIEAIRTDLRNETE